jgi:prevent-host-death family protein
MNANRFEFRSNKDGIQLRKMTEYGQNSALQEVRMRVLKVSEDIVPVSEFKAQASEWLRRVGESEQPVVITQNGKPAGVLLSPRAYDRLMEDLGRGAPVAQVPTAARRSRRR